MQARLIFALAVVAFAPGCFGGEEGASEDAGDSAVTGAAADGVQAGESVAVDAPTGMRPDRIEGDESITHLNVCSAAQCIGVIGGGHSDIVLPDGTIDAVLTVEWTAQSIAAQKLRFLIADLEEVSASPYTASLPGAGEYVLSIYPELPVGAIYEQPIHWAVDFVRPIRDDSAPAT